ncbi:ABC transporter permease [Streptomyces millisiae]|uniref:ABC-2 family transporter protein n=1 Tax=Streptomyces millisiae TaxID=3075542 RepID=A0ABU2LJ92_9ACTN|nr:ABC-2 family transporter protein [Streptomyces sp. DSM 44918]MDT0317650.1 ABC-2 family transporter protein [Streptomyces sp. DSM 44918]
MRTAARARGYGALLGAGWRTALAYRGALLLTALTTALSLVVQLAVWQAVYAEQREIADYDVTGMTTYLLAGNLLAVLLSNRVDDTLSGDIYRGDHVTGMLRPIGFLGTHAAIALPYLAVRLLLVVAPLLLCALGTVPLAAPAPAGLAWFLPAALLATTLGILLNLLVGLAGFVTTSTWGVRYLKGTVVAFCSGQLVPLELMPAAARSTLEWLPFTAMVATPVRLLLGRVEGAAAWGALGLQLLWTALGVLACALAWRTALRRGEVSGG